MAHKRLKGQKKMKMNKVRNKTKGTAKAKGKDRQQAKSAPSAKQSLATGAKETNKKEARAQASLEKQHQALYASGERILLVGEGNFSFAEALCTHLGAGTGVYATCLDAEAELSHKYPDAAQCRKKIEESLGGTCLCGVDATRLHKVKEFKKAFRKIVFNFPHLGSGEKDVEKNIAEHRKLLVAFFLSAVKCLDPIPDSRIHLALKEGEPYKSWKVVQTARAACPELELTTVVPFMPGAWPGYSHRRTAGFSDRFSKTDSEELAKGAKVYVFRRRREKNQDD